MLARSIERFILSRKLRETPSATLFRGYRRGDRAPVLVKVLREEYPSPIDVAKLRREHAILRSLDLPGVARTLGLEPWGNGLALVLEDPGGEPLDTIFRARALGLEASLRIAISLTAVVDSLHRQGVIHKDVNPRHFLFEEGASAPVLVDFGVATRLIHETHRAASPDLLEGTLAYMSPEQTGRTNRSLDRRTDLYALGVTLYELLTGVLPFTATDPLELVHSHIARTPASPHLIAPEVPPVLSDIVMRLLAKVAEDRYRSAAGLEADLQTCLGELHKHGRITSFPLGEKDFSEELRVPQRLYGREAESASLLAAFERARGGAAELLLISGYSGIGKSALVNEIQKQIVLGGHFIAGKFDQLHRSVPYGAIAQACRTLVESVLMEPSERLALRRRALTEALGVNGQVLVDIVPELALVIGPQPPVQEQGPSESRHRFELTFQNFLQAFTSAEEPLAFFLDDVQWADPASLRLIHLVLTAPRRGHLLVIAAYRDNEVGPMHPLTLALQELHKATVTVNELKLGPLGRRDVTELLADALGAKGTQVELLAELVQHKTHGNPFFLGQFLTALHKEKILSFNPSARGWRWDLEAASSAMVTDNVVDFMVGRLQRLAPRTQRALRLAACIGHQFDRRTLSVISEEPQATIAADLWEALREGLVLPVDDHHAHLHEGADPRDVGAVPSPESESPASARDQGAGQRPGPSYRFLHDRVQQAAYALIDDQRKQEVHARIGRLMLAQRANAPKDDELFDVVNHMNLGAAFLDAGERRVLARLDLTAGLRAKDAAAYGVALDLLRNCLDLLGDEAWTEGYDITFPASLAQAECESVSTHIDVALSTLAMLERNARTVMDRVSVLEVKLVALTYANRLPEAISCAIEAARLLGVEIPEAPAALGPAVGAEFAALQAALAGRDVESLIDLPLMRDPSMLALVNIFYKTCPAANQTNPDLTALMTLKAVSIALSHGSSPVSPFFHICYGMILGIVTQGFDTGYRFAQLGMRLNDRLQNQAVVPATHFLFGAFVSHFVKHISESVDLLRRGLMSALETGDHINAGYCASVGVAYRLFRGDALAELVTDISLYQEVLGRTDDVINSRFMVLVGRTIANLQGLTDDRASFGGPGFDEAELIKSILDGGNRHLIGNHHLFKSMILVLAGDYWGALAAADVAGAHAIPAFFMVTEQCFWHALALAGQLRSMPAPATAEGSAGASEDDGLRDRLLEGLRKDEETLALWARSAPPNHAHRRALVAAELAAATGDADRAMDQYDLAIALAREHGFTQHEALANELCAKFHLGRRRLKVASVYISEARYAYLRWGATAKVEELTEQFAELLAPSPVTTLRASSPPVPALSATLAPPPSAALAGAGRLDLASTIRATQAIASELVLSTLIERLMRILAENAGAQKGLLVLVRDGRPVVEASFAVDADVVRLGLAQDVEASADLSLAVVQYVARTQQAVVLGDAARESRFAADPYIARTRPKSLLCVPMLHQGRMAGVLYLENNAATSAFDPARTELLQVLAAQAATALENARLYSEVRAAKEQLLAANETLEAQVAQRTKDLNRTLSELWSEMDLALKVQTVLLPREPRLLDYQIAATMLAATNVGGDYYDILQTDGVGWLLIGDVSGHGVTAGLVSMMIQTAVRTVIQSAPAGADLSPSAVLSKVNAVLRGNMHKIGEDQYVTVMALQVRGPRVTYSGLHQDILVYRAASGVVERIETRGMWIGPVDEISTLLDDDTLELNDGDTMLLYSDGLTEARLDGAASGPKPRPPAEAKAGDRRVGTQGVIAAFQRLSAEGRDPGAITLGLQALLGGRAPADDVTLMVARYAPQEASR